MFLLILFKCWDVHLFCWTFVEMIQKAWTSTKRMKIKYTISLAGKINSTSQRSFGQLLKSIVRSKWWMWISHPFNPCHDNGIWLNREGLIIFDTFPWLVLCSFSFYFVVFDDSRHVFARIWATCAQWANESPKWNDKLEFQRQTGFYPPPSSHPVASLASQSSSTQKTLPNDRRLAAICPSKPSSPNARSKSACDNALGKGLTTMPVMSTWHGRHLKPALNLLVSSGGWQPAWKNGSSKQALCVHSI